MYLVGTVFLLGVLWALFLVSDINWGKILSHFFFKYFFHFSVFFPLVFPLHIYYTFCHCPQELNILFFFQSLPFSYSGIKSPSLIPFLNNSNLATLYEQMCFCGSFEIQAGNYETVVETKIKGGPFEIQKQHYSPVNLAIAPFGFGLATRTIPGNSTGFIPIHFLDNRFDQPWSQLWTLSGPWPNSTTLLATCSACLANRQGIH